MTDTLPDLELVYTNELIRLADLDATEAHNTALLAVYRAGQEASRWQPIDTAPIRPFDQKKWFMSHSPRLLLLVGKNAVIGNYGFTQKGKGRWVSDHSVLCGVTHWQPLPEPPQPEGAG